MTEVASKWICHHCISESYLSAVINRNGLLGECDYCDDESVKRWQMPRLAACVKAVFDENYELSDPDPDAYHAAMHHDKEIDYDWEREGEEIEGVLEVMLSVEREVVDELIELWRDTRGYSYDPRSDDNSEDPYGCEARYVEKPLDKGLMDARWNDVRAEVTHRSRFFSEQAKSFLNHVFEKVETLSGRNGSAIKTLDDKTAIYRARIAWTLGDQKRIIAAPQTELSSPPKLLATAGRMNASGITVFYGAMDSNTCLAEVRAPVGAAVVVAQFKPLRTLRLLDLKALEQTYSDISMFDPRYQDEIQTCRFLRGLSKKISAPVMPTDEPLDYVITQIICEFLATLRPQLDGILYPSTQSGNETMNVVLFSHANKIKVVDEKFDVHVHEYFDKDDDDNDGVSIYRAKVVQKPENLKTDKKNKTPKHNHFDDEWMLFDGADFQFGYANDTLEYVDGSLELFTIQAVSYKTTQTHIYQ